MPTPTGTPPAIPVQAHPPIQAHHRVTPRTVPWFQVGAAERPDTVVLVLHGLGQRAATLAASLASVAGATTTLVLPEALGRNLPHPGAPRAGACWSTGEDAAHDLADNVAWLDAVLHEVHTGLKPRRVVAVGFSQGGLTLARWLGWYGAHNRSLPLDRAILWGAALPGDLDLAHLAFGLGGTELVLAVGDADPFITPERSAALRARLHAGRDAHHGEIGGLRWRLHPYAGAHVIEAEALRAALQTLVGAL